MGAAESAPCHCMQACDGKAECLMLELRDAMFHGSNATREIDTLAAEATSTNDPFV